MKSWFRGIAAAFKSEATAQTFAGISILALSIYTGYNIPKPTMIGALRWITYINVRIMFNGACFLILRPFADNQPVKYGFESLIANEFHTIHANCATLVPQGSGYENVQLANQVCATVGSVPGQALVDGNSFIEISYGYSFGHVWRNFGILVAFLFAFVACLLLATEFNTSDSASSTVTLYKRGSKRSVTEVAVSEDLEKGAPTTPSDSSDR